MALGFRSPMYFCLERVVCLRCGRGDLVDIGAVDLGYWTLSSWTPCPCLRSKLNLSQPVHRALLTLVSMRRCRAEQPEYHPISAEQLVRSQKSGGGDPARTTARCKLHTYLVYLTLSSP